MQGSDIEKLGADWKAFRNRLEKMADESTEEAGRHVRMQELPVEVPFHEGQAGGFELVLSILDDFSAKKSPVSLNAIEEMYLGLLLDCKRMEGSAEALRTVLTEMQNLFDLPPEEQVEKDERFARRMREYGQDTQRPRR